VWRRRQSARGARCGAPVRQDQCRDRSNHRKSEGGPNARYTREPLASHTSSTDVASGQRQIFRQGRDIPQEWWRLFKSPTLNALIERALQNNPNLQSALATLRTTKESVYAQEGKFFPLAQANFNPTRRLSLFVRLIRFWSCRRVSCPIALFPATTEREKISFGSGIARSMPRPAMRCRRRTSSRAMRLPRASTERDDDGTLVGALFQSSSEIAPIFAGLMLADRITLAHFLISSTMNLRNSAGSLQKINSPVSVRRALNLGSASAQLISPLR
jgi:hypothetical protein